MNKVFFLFGLHNHQPIGNFEHVFDEAYEKCYAPILETLKKFPVIRISLHHSGPLLEWMEKNKPEYLDTLKGMVKAGQVEILSGGFYEPILSSLPEKDAIGQIEMMNRWVEKKLGVRPRGAWLAERIWDPALPRVLSAAGIEFTLLDDTHFHYAGLSDDDMYGYWVTERHGFTTAIFPIDKFLRYSIPFKQPEETLEYFKSVADKQGRIGVTYGDDGEKFGMWPETYEWVFGEKWLERFLKTMKDNPEVVETITYSEYLDKFPPKGRVYLPLASYEEMMHWTLPTAAALEHTRLTEELKKENRLEQFKPFLRGGLWDNFLVKYEESNNLHKKMLYISDRLELAKSKPGKAKAKRDMVRELYRGQCNCPYWHGLFGGLYLSNLRHAVYSHLIEAGRIADSLLHKKSNWVEINTLDLFKNRRFASVVETRDLSVTIDPSYGGTVTEIDFKPSAFNISNVLTRREEEYHSKLTQGDGEHSGGGDGSIASPHDRAATVDSSIEGNLVFDDVLRRSFTDYIFEQKPSHEELQKGTAGALPGWSTGAYLLTTESSKGATARLSLTRREDIVLSGVEVPLKMRKTFSVSGNSPEMECGYSMRNLSDKAITLLFGVEWNFTLLVADAPDRYITVDGKRHNMNSSGETEGIKGWSFTDEYFKFSASIVSSRPVTLLRYPVQTVFQSVTREAVGYKADYQGTAFVALQEISIEPQKRFSWKFSLSIKGLTS